jgi:hypothetical protein
MDNGLDGPTHSKRVPLSLEELIHKKNEEKKAEDKVLSDFKMLHLETVHI